MNNQEHHLTIVKEECIELAVEFLSLAKQCSKALRFGINEQRDLPTSNLERIQDEFNDLLGSVEKLEEVGIVLTPNREAIQKKKDKINKYLKYSKELGTLTD